MSRFSDYIQRTFDFTSREADEVIAAMIRPIGKSIRINTRKITLENFKLHAKEQGWILTDTDIPEVFLIDRADTSIALGNTIEHVAGWFYIQEVAAAMPPHLLRQEQFKVSSLEFRDEPTQNSKPKTQNSKEIILDMCASPGGKTTQLADYFPDSLIIANEVNRTRTPQLFDNLDRMGYDNIAVVSCDGRFFQNFPEYFDAVLLDAPCSGEGTAFRDASIIDHWHEKNIDRIAKLQKQLFETAETIVKPDGFISYSTCTLNKVENEEVINSLDQRSKSKEQNEGLDNDVKNPQLGALNSELLTSKSGESRLKKLFEKRFWPHIEHTGGFFASIFQKISPVDPFGRCFQYPILAAQGQKNLIVTPATKGEREIVERFAAKNCKSKLKSGFLYLTKDGVYFNQRNLGPLAQHFFFVHAGMRIGTIKRNTFFPTHHLYWCLDEVSIPSLDMTPAIWNEVLTRKSAKVLNDDGYYIVLQGKNIVGIGEVKKGEFIGI